MNTLPSLEELSRIRHDYHRVVQKHFYGEERFVDKAITAKCARFILGEIERKLAANPRCLVLDMGTGYSTCFIELWRQDRSNEKMTPLRYVGVEHDADWLAFMRDHVLPFVEADEEDCKLIERARFENSLYPEGIFDVVIVDHNPGLPQRAADVPWLVRLMAPDGVMLFDDWRPKHEGRIRRAFDTVGGQWDIVADDSLREAAYAKKTIGRVTRSLP